MSSGKSALEFANLRRGGGNAMPIGRGHRNNGHIVIPVGYNDHAHAK